MNKKYIAIIVILLVAGLAFLVYMAGESGYLRDEKSSQLERTERQKDHPELLIKDIETGEGPTVQSSDTVEVHYIGRLEDGSVFDSSYDKGRTFTFKLDKGRVILGWEIGVEGMKKGGKRILTIPPELAYGEGGVRGMVPPNSTIVFEIELIEIKD